MPATMGMAGRAFTDITPISFDPATFDLSETRAVFSSDADWRHKTASDQASSISADATSN